MKRRILPLGLLLAIAANASAGEDKLPKPLVSGLNGPMALAVGLGGRILVSEFGDLKKDDDGRVSTIEKGKAVPFATGFYRPGAMVAWTSWLFVIDEKGVWRIDPKGKAQLFVPVKAFPSPPYRLTDLTVDEHGVLYVADCNCDLEKGGKHSIWRIDQKGKVSLVVDSKRSPELDQPHCIVMDGKSHLLAMCFNSALLLRIKVSDGAVTKVEKAGGQSMSWDLHGRLFFMNLRLGIEGQAADWELVAIPRPGQKPILVTPVFRNPGSICFYPGSNSILVPDPQAGTVTAIPAKIPGWEVDDTPMSIKTAVAFPDLKWTGWEGVTPAGKVVPHRPLVLTHAGDGSNRVFVATQHGVIHAFPNDPKAKKTDIFLDIEKKVLYRDDENEQGLLGLAFHPQFKKNGEFFVFYSLKGQKLTNVISRFRVSKDNPNKADPDFEEEILRIQRPFWNHDGGTIVFGPDGYLYIALGDGGAADDPFKAGQRLNTLLAKVLRIDIDRKDEGKNYAIPKDNPFVGKEGARGEIWAYGLRNVWRMAFDRKTGKLWASDVGQNLYEEIDIIEKGGNYGWSIREGLHPFSKDGVGPRADLIDPIWEYHHDVGKSLTGGVVYRGKQIAALDGHYLYGDYITNKLWALKYDEAKRRVVANRPIPDPSQPVMSFGEDEAGEVYFMTASGSGKGIYRFVGK
jgi:glucose/arabinose dehydrogenase